MGEREGFSRGRGISVLAERCPGGRCPRRAWQTPGARETEMCDECLGGIVGSRSQRRHLRSRQGGTIMRAGGGKKAEEADSRIWSEIWWVPGACRKE